MGQSEALKALEKLRDNLDTMEGWQIENSIGEAITALQENEGAEVDYSGWKEQPEIPEEWKYLRDKLIQAYDEGDNNYDKGKIKEGFRYLQGTLGYAVMHINAHATSPEPAQGEDNPSDSIYVENSCQVCGETKNIGWANEDGCRKECIGGCKALTRQPVDVEILKGIGRCITRAMENEGYTGIGNCDLALDRYNNFITTHHDIVEKAE